MPALKTILGWGGGITTVGTVLFMAAQLYSYLDRAQLELNLYNETLTEVSSKLDTVHDRQDEITKELGTQTIQIGAIIDTDRERFSQREGRFEELETMNTETWRNQLLLMSKLGDLQFILGEHKGEHGLINGD